MQLEKVNYKDCMMQWAVRLRKLGMQQREFCNRFKINQSNLSEYLHGKTTPRVDMFFRIEKILAALEFEKRQKGE